MISIRGRHAIDETIKKELEKQSRNRKPKHDEIYQRIASGARKTQI
jgi:hypothetical protein